MSGDLTFSFPYLLKKVYLSFQHVKKLNPYDPNDQLCTGAGFAMMFHLL